MKFVMKYEICNEMDGIDKILVSKITQEENVTSSLSPECPRSNSPIVSI